MAVAAIRVLVHQLRHDPIEPLLARADPALGLAVARDLLDQDLDVRVLWELPFVDRSVHAQLADGSWRYAAQARRPREDYAQLATYKRLLVLVSIYRLDRRHPSLERAAEFLLRHQTAEGDLRGIYGAQYTPNYTADILRLLIEAGYEKDARVSKAMRWLLAMRQDDGGWAIPARTRGDLPLAHALEMARPIKPDHRRPSSHLVTGIVLRALAAHPAHRHTGPSVLASRLLVSRFFMPDCYPDHRAASHWEMLRYPFRWTDLVSSLDSVAHVGLDAADPHVGAGLRWLVDHQRRDGLWECGYPNDHDPLRHHWVSFAAARVFKRFFGRS